MTAGPAGMAHPHFIGIGGAGMSGIARILAQRGVRVAGSDARESPGAAALRELGATVHIGHAAGHLADDADCVVISSAIREENPELAAARGRGLPVLHRAEALARVMEGRRALAVAGTHGKTTTTSMLAVALRTMGLEPGYAIGGDLAGPGTNAESGGGEWFVAEADESDRSFLHYAPDVAIILNAELDHHANYASIEEIYDSFLAFADRIRPGGTLVVNADEPGARELTARLRARDTAPRLVTCGDAGDADVRVLRVLPKGLASEVTVLLDGSELSFAVNVPGRHYAHNAVAALAAGVAAGLPAAELAGALGSYTGVARRLQIRGEEAGVRVIDSYAHHPTEMTADLRALREAAEGGRVVVVYQPHLFSRTRELGTEMGRALALADRSLVLDIYPAREDPLPGITSELVVASAASAGADVRHADAADIPATVADLARPGDLVVTMGAGDVTDLGPEILARLSRTH